MITHWYQNSEVVQKLTEFVLSQLRDFLGKGPTLLLLSGGSVGSDVAPVLVKTLTSAKNVAWDNLTVALVDERFGPVGHKESNAEVLRKNQVLETLTTVNISFVMPLTSEATSLEAATSQYEAQLASLFERCRGSVVGIFGLGTDGHTAGIKPQLDEITYRNLFRNGKIVIGYRSNDFKRITLSIDGMSYISVPIIYATGKSKRDVIKQLFSGASRPEYDFPAVVFKKLTNVHLFTDQYDYQRAGAYE